MSLDCPALSKDAANHLKVLRPKDGEAIELFDGRGHLRRCRYSSAAKSLVADGEVVEVSKSAGAAITLFACVTKGSRWDWTIEKATELGVARIVPVISERTVVRIAKGERAAKCERWMRIAEDAARQSDAAWLPEISEAVDFGAAAEMAKATTCFIGALTKPPARPLAAAVAEALAANPARPVAVFIGPEGDFTPEELSALMAFGIPTSFGRSVLRAETAAIFAVSVAAALVFARRRD